MTNIESERLILRMWESRDFDKFAAFNADVESARYIGGACDRATAWRRMAAELGHWTLRGYGFWALEEKQSGALVGCAGLWFPEGWPELEVGYWLMPEARGKGYATEAVLRSRRFAYDDVGATTLISCIHPENRPSQRVAERVGAHHESTRELHTYGPHCIYRHPGPATPS